VLPGFFKAEAAELGNTVAPTDGLVSSQNNWLLPEDKQQKKCWPWTIRHTPRLVVVVRWYIDQKLYPLLTTLNSAADLTGESLAVMIVDTQPIPVNTSARGEISYRELKRQIFKCSSLVPWLRVQGLKAPVLPSDLENRYGYGETDWVLEQQLDVEDWDHIMFTNGDNTYSRYLLQQTLQAREFGYALIGFDFVHHRYQLKGNSGQAVKVKNTLRWLRSDLGSLIFHRSVVGRRGVNRCFCGLTFQEASRQHGWFAADAGLMELTQQCTNGSQIVIHQLLFQHQ